jgi:eukaryotic-like serine/threonine-protein kinase
MSAEINLTITHGQNQDRIYSYNSRDTIIIGRADDCHIRFDDQNVSRYHCQLTIDPPQAVIRDLNSSFGTFLNGNKLTHQVDYTLKAGNKITVGNNVLEFNICINGDQVTPVVAPGKKQFNLDPVIPPPKQNLFQLFRNLFSKAQSEPQLRFIANYQLEQKLGVGGFGEVYLAKNSKTRELVAIKIMLPETNADDYKRESFLREVENMKALNHPNIVQLKNYGPSEQGFYFVMEYCDQGTVIDFMNQKGGVLSIKEAVPICLEILSALEYAHQATIPYVKLAGGGFTSAKGLVHRDVKPNNILLKTVNGQRVAKLGDFGLSKSFENAGLTQLTTVGFAGSFYFIPKGQIINFKFPEPRMDVWAVAACLYYMLTGKYPRDFDNPDHFLTVLQTKPILIQRRDPRIPNSLAELIDLALQDDPKIYFQNATAFKTALTNVFNSL